MPVPVCSKIRRHQPRRPLASKQSTITTTATCLRLLHGSGKLQEEAANLVPGTFCGTVTMYFAGHGCDWIHTEHPQFPEEANAFMVFRTPDVDAAIFRLLETESVQRKVLDSVCRSNFTNVFEWLLAGPLHCQHRGDKRLFEDYAVRLERDLQNFQQSLLAKTSP